MTNDSKTLMERIQVKSWNGILGKVEAEKVESESPLQEAIYRHIGESMPTTQPKATPAPVYGITATEPNSEYTPLHKSFDDEFF